MVPTVWIGALLVICGLLFLAWSAISRGRMSQPHSSAASGPTLEPDRRGLRFLGLGDNWPGIVMMAVGALLLLVDIF